MRALRTIAFIGLALALLIGFLWLLPTLLNPQYFGLQRKSAKWYAEFTAACDSVLAQHPLGTNETITLSVTDPSLPKIITALHPIMIHVGHDRFWMLLGSYSHAGFGLTWDPQWDNTNVWVLHTTAESVDTVLYSAMRTPSPTNNTPPTAR